MGVIAPQSPFVAQQEFRANAIGGPLKVTGRGQKWVQDALVAPSVMASPPTLTLAAGTTTVITGSSLIGPTDARFAWLGPLPAVAGAGAGYRTSKDMLTNDGSLLGATPFSISFETDADKFEILLQANSAKFRLFVDDQPHKAAPIAFNDASITSGAVDYNNHLLLVDFGSRATRRIRIETENVFSFGGIRIGATSTLWAPSRPLGPKVAFMGDSFTFGQQASSQAAGYVLAAAKQLGWLDVADLGIGGTGWLYNATPNTHGYGTVRQRIPVELVPLNPDVVIIAMGSNDQNLTGDIAAQLAAEVPLALALLASSLPKARVVVIGPFSGRAPVANLTTVNTTVKAACAAAGVPYIDTVTTPWITGTGKTTSTNGTGNSDFYTGSDGTHWSDAGYAYAARRVAGELANYFPLS